MGIYYSLKQQQEALFEKDLLWGIIGQIHGRF